MREPPDPLEAELSALRPYEPSLGLRRRVAERLSDSPPAQRRPLRRLVFAAGLVAACLAAVLLWWGGRSEHDGKGLPGVVSTGRVTPRLSDVAGSAAWWETRRGLDGADTAAFAWPLEEASPMRVSSAISSDLLE